MTQLIAAGARQASGDVWWACLLLLGAVIMLFMAAVYVRRRWLQPPEPSATVPWTLDDLRKLRDEGQLTSVEFETLKAVVVDSFAKRRPTDGKPRKGASTENPSDFDVKPGPRT